MSRALRQLSCGMVQSYHPALFTTCAPLLAAPCTTRTYFVAYNLELSSSRKRGGRFSRKARLPSRASSLR